MRSQARIRDTLKIKTGLFGKGTEGLNEEATRTLRLEFIESNISCAYAIFDYEGDLCYIRLHCHVIDTNSGVSRINGLHSAVPCFEQVTRQWSTLTPNTSPNSPTMRWDMNIAKIPIFRIC
jgi:hypothetical protein